MGFFKELKEDIVQSVSELTHSLEDDLEQNQNEEMSKKRVIEDIVLEEPEKKYLAELERSFMNPEEDLPQQDTDFQEREEALAEQEPYLVEREETLSEQESYPVEREEILAEQEPYPVEQEEILSEQESYPVEREEILTEPESDLVEREEILTEPELDLVEREETLPEQDAYQIKPLDPEQAEPDTYLQKQEEMSPESDTYLFEIDKDVLEPDGEMEETASDLDPEAELTDPAETELQDIDIESKEDLTMNEGFENEVNVENVEYQMDENMGGADTQEVSADDIGSDEEMTVITQGTTISGNIKSDTSLLVKGTIEGDVECQGRLTIYGRVSGNTNAKEVYVNTPHLEGDINSVGNVKIDAGTIVIGNINCASLVIAGAVKGDLDVNGPVVIDSTAVVKGNVRAKSVQINNGAVVDGSYTLAYADTDLDAFFGQ